MTSGSFHYSGVTGEEAVVICSIFGWIFRYLLSIPELNVSDNTPFLQVDTYLIQMDDWPITSQGGELVVDDPLRSPDLTRFPSFLGISKNRYLVHHHRCQYRHYWIKNYTITITSASVTSAILKKGVDEIPVLIVEYT